MAKLVLTLISFVLVLSSLVVTNNARPIRTLEHENSIDTEIMKVLDDLYVQSIKTGGPSRRGDGHAATNALTLGGIKKSGPSPGDRHAATTALTLEGIKKSGPSGGDGHAVTTALTLEGIKKSGPSPGDGH